MFSTGHGCTKPTYSLANHRVTTDEETSVFTIMPIQQIAVRPLAAMKDRKTNVSGPAKGKDSACETMHADAVTTCGTERCESQLSTTSSGADICRICHCEAEINNPLISPCLCSGSLKYVHMSCLQKWIKSSEKNVCELCKFRYIMTTKTKPFKEWERLEMPSAERRKIICSVTFHMIAITCVIWSLYVLIDRTTEEVANGNLNWPFWTKLIVVAIGFTGGLVFMYVQCKMYVQLCLRWRTFNRIIYIENAPEDEEVRAQLAAKIKESTSKTEEGGLTNTAAVNELEMF